jgi:hypothetical protein
LAASADADVGLGAVVDTDLTEVGLCPGNRCIVESERQVYRVWQDLLIGRGVPVWFPAPG